MKARIKRLFWISLGLVLLIATVQFWYLRPSRAAGRFLSYLSKGQYEEAQTLLATPSSIEPTETGALVLTDRAGHTTTVPAGNLPFLVLEEEASSPDSPTWPARKDDFTMIALGESEGGILEKPPFRLYLRADGGEVHIERVE